MWADSENMPFLFANKLYYWTKNEKGKLEASPYEGSSLQAAAQAVKERA